MLAMSQPQSVSQVLHGGVSSAHQPSADPRQLPSQPGLQNQLPLPQLPLRPATPTPASVAAAAVAGATDTTMTDQKDDHHHSDNKSEKDSDSEQSQDGGKRKKSKRRPHKFYCTDFPPCKLSFTRSEHLSRHIRRHTGERPFKCHCNRAFTRLDNLRQHAQTVHANETIPPDSLAAHGGRNRQNMSRGKRASISQHPVNSMPPMGMSSGHSRSLSTPVATYSAQPVYPPPASYNGAPMQQYHPQHPSIPPNGHPSMSHGPPPQNWGPGGPPQPPQQGQYPAGPPQFTRPVYGQPMPAPQMSRGPPAPPTGHGHSRSRSLMTPAEISRPGPSSLRDNMNRLRQPSFGGPSGALPAGLPNGAPANGYSNLPLPPPPPPPPSSSSSSSSSSFAPSHRGHNRGQSHSAVIGHSGHSTFGHSFSGPSSHSIRTINSGPRESRLPQYNLREEMERARSNGSSNNTGNTNSQSPSTPNDDYVQSPITSPIFSTGQDFGGRDYPRERGSISSFDLGRGSISNGDGGDRLAPLPRPAVRETGLPALSLAAYSSHSRSHSWSQTPFNVTHDLRLPPLLLPDNQDMSRPKGPLMEPKPDM